MTTLCQATWKAGSTTEGPRVCQAGTPQPAERRFDGVDWCGPCYVELVKTVRAKSGRSRVLVKAAMIKMGKEAGGDRDDAMQKLKDQARAKIQAIKDKAGWKE